MECTPEGVKPDHLSPDERRVVLWLLETVRRDTAEAFADMSRFDDVGALHRYLDAHRANALAIYFLQKHRGLTQELAEIAVDDLVDNADLLSRNPFPEESVIVAAMRLGTAVMKLRVISCT